MSRPDAAERPDDDAQAQRVTWFDRPERPVGTVYVRPEGAERLDAEHRAWLDMLPPPARALAERDLADPPSREEIRDALELLLRNLAGTDLDAAWVLAVSFCTARAGMERLSAECNATADSLMKVAGQRIAALAVCNDLDREADARTHPFTGSPLVPHREVARDAAARIRKALGATTDG